MNGTRISGRLAKLAGIVAIAAMEASAQQACGQRRLVISIPDRKMALLEDDRAVKIYDIAVGKPSTPSPAGEFHIVSRVAHPAWYTPGRVVAPGKNNPLGTRWLGLSASGYGIHGTNVPGSIGKAASHGCIRMRNRDVEELFELVEAGVAVELYQERTASIAKILSSAD